MSTGKKESKVVGGMELFHTRQKANEGIKVPLYTPAGKETEHWVRIRGVDSDEFRLAEAESKRGLMRIAQIEDPRERQDAIEDAKRELVAVLVISWSFEMEPTLENVKAFFKEAPQIADAIDRASSSRALFFAAGSSSSQDTQSTSSAST